MMTFRPGQRLVISGVQVFMPGVTSAGGGFAGVLDGISNIAVAYGLRKLRSAYSGSAVRVRRSSDSTEQDIGFDSSGEFDSSAFGSFVGGGTGYVKTWYDQSGNARDATQTSTTSQPNIVLSVTNSRPAILFTAASSTFLTLGAPAAIDFAPTDAYTLLCCYRYGSGTGYVITKFSASAAAPFALLGQASTASFAQPYTANLTTGGAHGGTMAIASVVTPATTGAGTGRVNGGVGTSLTRGSTNTVGNGIDYLLGARRGTNNSTTAAHFGGHIAEFIVSTVAMSAADHNTIGADMATRFGLSWTNVT